MSITVTSHYDCMQPLGFRGSLSLNAVCKRVATGYGLSCVLSNVSGGPLLEIGIWIGLVFGLIQQGYSFVLRFTVTANQIKPHKIKQS